MKFSVQTQVKVYQHHSPTKGRSLNLPIGGVSLDGIPTKGGVPDCRLTAPRRTSLQWLSSRAPFIPQLNLIGAQIWSSGLQLPHLCSC